MYDDLTDGSMYTQTLLEYIWDTCFDEDSEGVGLECVDTLSSHLDLGEVWFASV